MLHLALEDVGDVDLVFDVIGGHVQKRSAALIKVGGTLVSVVGPVEARPADGLAVDFVVEADRAQLGEIVQRVRDGRLLHKHRQPSRPSMMPSQPSTPPSGSRVRRSSSFAHKDVAHLSTQTRFHR